MKTRVMSRSVPIAVVLAMVLLLGGEALARHGGAHRFTGAVIGYKQAVTTPIAASTQSQAFVAIPTMSLVVPVFPGRRALINARFHAESQCTGPTLGSWCSVRILIAGVPGEPNQGDGSDFAFDAVSTPAVEQDFWEGHAIERHLCVRNNRAATVLVTVVAQWRTVGAAGTTFRLDERTLAAERSENCSTDTAGFVVFQ
jgi:hypothetical protein